MASAGSRGFSASLKWWIRAVRRRFSFSAPTAARARPTIGRSDTTILLRVAPDQINLLSIPRDLKVFIPGHGVDKFNAAYTDGGPKLTTETVHQLTGLKPNVVVNINFNGFANAVNEIGCVYVDVDHHYYHSNAGLAAADQYAEINIPAGYQRMCGYNALSFVRYRHDDNDLVRSARQQAFLREARAQVPATKFLDDYGNLTDIFKKATTSTISNLGQLIGLGRLFFSAKDAQVREIHFPANAGSATDTYLTASSTAIKEVVAEFQGSTPPPRALRRPRPRPHRPQGSPPAGRGHRRSRRGRRSLPSRTWLHGRRATLWSTPPQAVLPRRRLPPSTSPSRGPTDQPGFPSTTRRSCRPVPSS